MTQPSPEVADHARKQLIEQLADKHRDHLDPGVDADLVTEVWDDLAGTAGFNTYLSVIVRRRVEDRVRQLRSESDSGRPSC